MLSLRSEPIPGETLLFWCWLSEWSVQCDRCSSGEQRCSQTTLVSLISYGNSYGKWVFGLEANSLLKCLTGFVSCRSYVSTWDSFSWTISQIGCRLEAHDLWTAVLGTRAPGVSGATVVHGLHSETGFSKFVTKQKFFELQDMMESHTWETKVGVSCVQGLAWVTDHNPVSKK